MKFWINKGSHQPPSDIPGARRTDVKRWGDEMWEIEIDTLDELLAIAKEYGIVVACEEYKGQEEWEITIYDAFLE